MRHPFGQSDLGTTKDPDLQGSLQISPGIGGPRTVVIAIRIKAVITQDIEDSLKWKLRVSTDDGAASTRLPGSNNEGQLSLKQS